MFCMKTQVFINSFKTIIKMVKFTMDEGNLEEMTTKEIDRMFREGSFYLITIEQNEHINIMFI